MNKEFEEKVKYIKEKVGKTSLYIGRIPEKSKTEFKELAKTEFEGDYGFTLKFLLDFRSGLLSDPNQILSDRIDLLATEVANLKGQVKEKSVKKRKMLSGREIRTGGDKNESAK